MKAASLLKTTRNTRDLGGHPAAGGRVTVPDRIWRSDRQENPDPEDIALLRSKGITTIIDMRTEEDNLTKPSFFRSLEGFTFLNYPIIEGDTIPESVEAVPGSYINIARSENMPRILKAIADADTGVMYNCAAGKDRTGVVTAILLMLCGVSDEEITADYMLTKECNRERFELLRKRRPISSFQGNPISGISWICSGPASGALTATLPVSDYRRKQNKNSLPACWMSDSGGAGERNSL